MNTYTHNVAKIKEIFEGLDALDEKYEMLIDLGKKEGRLPEELKTADTQVIGCQSRTYLVVVEKEGRLFFQIDSDAFISAGIASLMRMAYDGLNKEEILREKPLFLEELGLLEGLSLSRINGAFAMYKKMVEEVLKRAN